MFCVPHWVVYFPPNLQNVQKCCNPKHSVFDSLPAGQSIQSQIPRIQLEANQDHVAQKINSPQEVSRLSERGGLGLFPSEF